MNCELIAVDYKQVAIKSYHGHGDDVSCCAFSADLKLLVTGGDDCQVCAWSLEKSEPLLTGRAHVGGIRSVCYSDDACKIASGGFDGLVCVWDICSGKPFVCLVGHRRSVEAVAFAPGGAYLCSGSSDKAMIVWDLFSERPMYRLHVSESMVQCCCFSLGGEFLAAGCWDYSIYLYDIKEEDNICTDGGNLISASGEPQSESFSHSIPPDELRKTADAAPLPTDSPHLVYSGVLPVSLPLIVKNRRSSDCNDPLILRRHSGNVRALSFSSLAILASASWDRSLCLWNPSTGDLLHVLEGHEGFVQTCSFSPDGLYLSSAADDQTIKIWDASSGTCMKTLCSSLDEIYALALSKEGRLLAAGPEKLSFY